MEYHNAKREQKITFHERKELDPLRQRSRWVADSQAKHVWVRVKYPDCY